MRVTARCAQDDLGGSNDDFDALLRHEIVEGFKNERCKSPIGATTVGPEAGEATLYTLRRGNDHRGATWYERQQQVVWLCAYGHHRSGEPDDAFRLFGALLKDDAIYPTEEDYDLLERDRDERIAAFLIDDAQGLLKTAREHPGREHRGVLGGDFGVSVAVEVAETLEETSVAFLVTDLTRQRLIAVLAAFHPEAQFDEWELCTRLLSRNVSPDEVCYRILRG